MTLTSASPTLPERGHSLELLGGPVWLFLLLSLPVLSCLPVSPSCSFYIQCLLSWFVIPRSVSPGSCIYPTAYANTLLLLSLCLALCSKTAQDPSPILTLPRPTPACLDLQEGEGGLPQPCLPESGSLLTNAFSAYLFQVQLYVWHVLPLGKDLLHRISAVLQAGGYLQQLPWSRVAGQAPGAWVCALE